MTNAAHVCAQTKHVHFFERAENESARFLRRACTENGKIRRERTGSETKRNGCHACRSLRLNRTLKNSSCRYALRPWFSFRSHDLSRCRLCGASARTASHDTPAARTRTSDGRHHQGGPAAGIVPVRELIEANRRMKIFHGRAHPRETAAPSAPDESIPNAEPIPGETHLQLPSQATPSIPPSAFSPVPSLSMKHGWPSWATMISAARCPPRRCA